MNKNLASDCNWGFPGGSVVKNPPANAGDGGSNPRSGDPLEEEMATGFSILAWKNAMDRRGWRATVHGVAKSWIPLGIQARTLRL